MHRPAWLRLLIAVWGLWFATSVVEPAGLFACEMHGAPVHRPAAAAHDLSAAQNAAPGHHADHVSPAAPAGHRAAAAAKSDAPLPQQHSCCTCLGHCCQSAPVAVSSPAVMLGHLAERDADIAAITLVSRAVTRRPYDLPFANGPPVFTL